MKRLRGPLILTALSLLAACASDFVTVSPQPPAQYTRLGPASGRACGSLLALDPAWYILPAWLNSRVERAYSAALASVPGATSLVDVTYQEDWVWWLIGTARCVTITGEAIK